MIKAEASEREKQKLADLVDELILFIKENRVAVMNELVRNAPSDVVDPDELFKNLETAKKVFEGARDEGARDIIPVPRARLARELYRLMPDEMIERGVELWEGHFINEKHGWFMVQGEAELVEDTQWVYVVDPASIGVVALGDKTSDILLLLPWSALHRVYVGNHVEL